MGVLEFLKRFLCSGHQNNNEAAVTFVNNQPESSIKDVETAMDNITIANVIKPLSTAEILSMNDEEIEINHDDLSPIEFEIHPLPNSGNGRFTLVLDIDNTLVYSSTKELEHFDHQLSIHYNGKTQNIWVVERPGLKEFLSLVEKYYEIVLFTAGIRQYGIKVMKQIDTNKKVSYFLDRRFCTFLGRNSKDQEVFAKDVGILGREESEVVLVDDREYSFALNSECGILVPSFDGDLNDECLKKLGSFLVSCSNLNDLRQRKSFSISGDLNKNQPM